MESVPTKLHISKGKEGVVYCGYHSYKTAGGEIRDWRLCSGAHSVPHRFPLLQFKEDLPPRFESLKSWSWFYFFHLDRPCSFGEFGIIIIMEPIPPDSGFRTLMRLSFAKSLFGKPNPTFSDLKTFTFSLNRMHAWWAVFDFPRVSNPASLPSHLMPHQLNWNGGLWSWSWLRRESKQQFLAARSNWVWRPA